MCFETNHICCTHADSHTDQTYAFWRPHAPPGFAVLGDNLTPLSVKILIIFIDFNLI